MTISTGDIIKVVATLVWLDGNIMQNVFNATVSGGGGPWADEDIVDDALAWINNMFANIVGSMSDECDGSQIQVYVRDPVGADWDEVGSNAWTFDPGSASDQIPRGAAGLITCRSDDPDVQGKKYLGGFTEASLTDGLVIPGLLTLMLAFAADWVTEFTGSVSAATWTPGIWSPTGSVIFDCQDSISASAIPAYQRRRKRGVGA